MIPKKESTEFDCATADFPRAELALLRHLVSLEDAEGYAPLF